MADKAEEKAPKVDPADAARAKARADAEKQAEDIRNAVYDRTHDANGDPKPIVIEG